MLIAISISFILSVRSVNLVWKPKVGDTVTYHWKATSDDFPGPSGITSIVQEVTDQDTIKEIKPNGDVVVEVKVSDVKASMGGVALAPKAQGVSTETLLVNSKGVILDRQTDSKDDTENPRLVLVERLVYPDHPVNVGDAWTYKEPANSVKGTYDNESTYTFSGSQIVQDRLAKRIAVEYKETGTLLSLAGSGNFWISPTNGAIVKEDLTVSNLSTGGRFFKLRIQSEQQGSQ